MRRHCEPLYASTACSAPSGSAVGSAAFFRTGQSIAFTIGRYALRDFVTAQIERFPRWKQARVLTEA